MGKTNNNKLPVFINILLYLVVLSSCSEDQGLFTQHAQMCTPETRAELSIKEAIEIAHRTLGKSYKENLVVSHIFESDTTQSRSGVIDTLAYVVNYNDNDGYAIISKKAIEYPVLAYSNTGTFSTAGLEPGDPVYDIFVSKLPLYLDASSERPSDPFDSFYTTSHVVPTLLDIEPWHQKGIFSRYVEKQHPGCPVGCAPLAMVYTMIHCNWGWEDTSRNGYYSSDVIEFFSVIDDKLYLTGGYDELEYLEIFNKRK